MNLEGALTLKKEQQKSISGGGILIVGAEATSCNEEADCYLSSDNPLIPWSCVGGSCIAGA